MTLDDITTHFPTDRLFSLHHSDISGQRTNNSQTTHARPYFHPQAQEQDSLIPLQLKTTTSLSGSDPAPTLFPTVPINPSFRCIPVPSARSAPLFFFSPLSDLYIFLSSLYLYLNISNLFVPPLPPSPFQSPPALPFFDPI